MSEPIKIEYDILIEWDEEASVWVATSDEVNGLVLESDHMEDLLKKVSDAVPELLELNGQVPASKLNCKITNRQVVYA